MLYLNPSWSNLRGRLRRRRDGRFWPCRHRLDLLVVVEDVLFEDLTDGGVVPVHQLDHLNGRVDEHNDEDDERYNATCHSVHRRLSFQIEGRQRSTENIK